MKFRPRSRLIKERKFILLLVLTIGLVGAGVFIGYLFLNSEPSERVYDGFPDFITKNEDYYITRIGPIPNINADLYRFSVWGEVNITKDFTLDEFRALNLTERTVTIECIGNPSKGSLLSTAVWKGFLVYDLLTSLGLKQNATGVKYKAADGYYVSHTLEQIENNGTIGAIYMNGETLPANQGFPLRIVTPGAYGAKQPAWVTEIEVMSRPLEDYWDDRGWDTSPPMDVDSKIFFPQNNFKVNNSISFELGGAAYGGTRISKVEYTTNQGLNWSQANIVQSLDFDHVWVFWNASIIFGAPGSYQIHVKATDIYNNTQPQVDSNALDGSNGWPSISVVVL
ncbi:MAG: molybdopterin-dependent oxidoreductase [Promethearchaeota archaeon]